MKRQGRLDSAPKFLAEYTGKNIVKGYAKWYNVDLVKAAIELRLAGVEIPEERMQQLVAHAEAEARRTQEAKARRLEEQRIRDAEMEFLVSPESPYFDDHYWLYG